MALQGQTSAGRKNTATACPKKPTRYQGQIYIYIYISSLLTFVYNNPIQMWTLFTKALAKGSSTTQVSIINTSTNFMLTALLGLWVFGEALPPMWWAGATLLVIGNVVVGRKDEQPQQQQGGDGGAAAAPLLRTDDASSEGQGQGGGGSGSKRRDGDETEDEDEDVADLGDLNASVTR